MPTQIYPIDKSGEKRPLVRTYHGRQGRLSANRLRVLEELVPKYSVSKFASPQDFRKVFDFKKVVIDFGCGMGRHTKELLEQGHRVIAIDVYTAGICDVVEYAHKNEIKNLKVHHGDGISFLSKNVISESISEVHVYFPDPWPKARHEKRRLFTETFLKLLFEVLEPEGKVIVVTDDANYAQLIHNLVSDSKIFSEETFKEKVSETSYHLRARDLNNQIYKFSLRKRSGVRQR